MCLPWGGLKKASGCSGLRSAHCLRCFRRSLLVLAHHSCDISWQLERQNGLCTSRRLVPFPSCILEAVLCPNNEAWCLSVRYWSGAVYRFSWFFNTLHTGGASYVSESQCQVQFRIADRSHYCQTTWNASNQNQWQNIHACERDRTSLDDPMRYIWHSESCWPFLWRALFFSLSRFITR